MEKKFKLKASAMPNFISMDRPAGARQDGFNYDFKIDITELTEDEAIEYAELLKHSFIDHYRQRKDNARR